jgi:hypothetical protein
MFDNSWNEGFVFFFGILLVEDAVRTAPDPGTSKTIVGAVNAKIRVVEISYVLPAGNREIYRMREISHLVGRIDFFGMEPPRVVVHRELRFVDNAGIPKIFDVLKISRKRNVFARNDVRTRNDVLGTYVRKGAFVVLSNVKSLEPFFLLGKGKFSDFRKFVGVGFWRVRDVENMVLLIGKVEASVTIAATLAREEEFGIPAVFHVVGMPNVLRVENKNAVVASARFIGTVAVHAVIAVPRVDAVARIVDVLRVETEVAVFEPTAVIAVLGIRSVRRGGGGSGNFGKEFAELLEKRSFEIEFSTVVPCVPFVRIPKILAVYPKRRIGREHGNDGFSGGVTVAPENLLSHCATRAAEFFDTPDKPSETGVRISFFQRSGRGVVRIRGLDW